MVKKIQRVSPQQPSEHPVRPINLPDVREEVPDWLRMLLVKYGEAEGRLVGLEMGSVSEEEMIKPPPPATEEESQVSSLLEQMAVTGIDAASDTDIPTSVEWGTAPAESAPSIDDLLTSMEIEQPEYAQQGYVKPDYEETDSLETQEGLDEQDSADWISDTPTAPPVQDYAQPPQDYAIPSSGGKDVPDWLTEALAEPSSVGTTISPPAQTPAPSSVGDDDVPDWLTEALDMPSTGSPPVAPVEQVSPPPPVPADQDIPDWLSETPSESGEPVSAESSPAAVPGPDSFATDIPDWQVPDWITEGMDELSVAGQGEGTLAQEPTAPEPDIPDWIANGGTPTTVAEPAASPTPETRQIPDWLASVDEEPPLVDEVGSSLVEEDAEVPEWLVSESEVSATAVETPAEQIPSVPQEEVDVPPWLQNLQTEPSLSPTLPSAGVPEWLESVQVSTETAVIPPTQPPDWLQSIQADAVEARETREEPPAPVSKLKRLRPAQRPSPEPDTASLPDWTVGLVPPVAAGGQVSSALPQWADDLIPSEVASETAVSQGPLPDWAETLVPPGHEISGATKETAELEEEPAPQAELYIPFEVTEVSEAAKAPSEPAAEIEHDWLADLRETVPTEVPLSPEPAEPTAEAEIEIPAWLTGAEETSVEEALAAGVEQAIEPGPEIPEWLGETEPEVPTSVEPVDEIELEMPAWLTGAEETSAEEVPAIGLEPGPERPEWLGETEPEVPTPVEPVDEPELEMPAWLAGIEEMSAEKPSVSGTEVGIEPELEMPDWLMETETEAPTAPEVAAGSELEMPAWLSETEELAAEETLVASIEPQAETETETPFWLGEIPEEVSTESLSTEFAAETEIEIPDWLSDVDETPAQEIPPVPLEPDVDTKSEMPAWLAELPEAQPEEPPPTLAESAPEVEVEMPTSLSGMEQEPTEETPDALTEPSAEVEPELPSWLRELREADLEAPITDETAAGIATELPDTEVETPPSVPIEPTAEAEFEMPAWLSETEQEPSSEALSAAPVESTAEVKPETPAWLSDLPEVDSEEWIPEFSEPIDQAEAAMPDWLSGGEEVLADQPPAEPTAETEAELPPWLIELQRVQAGEPEPTPVETTVEAEPEPPFSPPEVEQAFPEEEPPVSIEADVDVEAETPPWLSELLETEPEMPTTIAPEPTSQAEAEMPAWLWGIEQAPPEETDIVPTEPTPETEVETPAWLSGLEEAPDEQFSAESTIEEELELPPWLTELPDDDTEQPPVADSEAETPDWLSDIMVETSSEESSTEVPVEEESEMSWMFDEEPPLPPWLSESSESETDEKSTKATDVDDGLSDSSETTDQDREQTPSDQGWLTGLREATEAVKTVLSPEDADKVESPPPPPPTTDKSDVPESDDTDLGDIKASQASAPSSIAGSSPRGQVSGWLQALKPVSTAELVVEAEDSQAAEDTGVLAGLAGLMPVEKMVTAAPGIEPRPNGRNGHAEAVLKAAHNFFTIATQPPQPATLPTPVTQQRKRFSSNMVRAGLFLLFIILVAFPLLPSLQRGTSWTEPADELNNVLGDWRRQMISEELGIIDVQQPGSVALVSFDYSTATQGEMQPLAEAIIGRLKGQGMRVIFTSLEPEGAALAQAVLDQKRAEAYGVNMVNLGYLPGQAAAIRALATGQSSLSTIPDFREHLTFDQRANWGDVDNLGQVELIVTLADNPATARWWIEQLQMVPPPEGGERFLLAATSAVAAPFLQPYRHSNQLDGLITGINGAAAVEASRQQFGPARQMLDSQSIAHLFIIILIAAGTVAGWMPRLATSEPQSQPEEID